MKFKLKQEKMEELMEKLSLVDMYPSVVIVVKKDETTGKPVMFSIQREASGRALRYLKVKDTFFDEIENPETQEAIEIDAGRVLKAVKKILPGTVLEIEKEGNKLKISGEYEDKDDKGNVTDRRKTLPYITFTDPEEVVTTLPLDFDKHGTPLIGKNKLPLNVDIKINIDDLKEATDYASVFDTEFFKFDLKQGEKLSIRIGDLRDFSDYWRYQPRYTEVAGNELSVILTYGMKQIASVFKGDITFRAATNSPCWIYEKTDDYTVGVLIPPHIPSEEEAVE